MIFVELRRITKLISELTHILICLDDCVFIGHFLMMKVEETFLSCWDINICQA